jgi:hypothetical protein
LGWSTGVRGSDMRNRVERFFRYLKGENCSIPPQDEHKRSHTRNHKPQAIPKPIHNILPGYAGGEVSENAYLDTIPQLRKIFKLQIF